MAQGVTTHTGKGSFHGLLSRGESAVAPTGLALILILAGSLTAAGWWSVRTQDQALHRARAVEIRATGDMLAQATGALMAHDDLSGLRRLVMNTATEHALTTCRVVSPDGSVIADADPGRITLTTLSATWNTTAAAPTFIDAGNQISMSRPLNIPGRGALTLEIAAGPRATADHLGFEAGLGAVGAIALLALMILYRHLRQQLRPLYAVGESLNALIGGETDTAALTVAGGFGPQAQAWNQILTQRQQRQSEQLDQEARATVGRRTGAAGDLGDAANALSQGLMVVDDQFQMAYLNGAAAVFLGAKRDDLMHKPLEGAHLSDAASDAIRQAIQGPSRQRQTLEIERHSGQGQGQGVLRIVVRPITRGQAPAAVVVIDDITQQRVSEQSRNTFLAQATHELRTPLTNIRLYVDTALETDDADGDAKLRGECLNVINQESARLERLVTDMLSISEIEAGSMSLKTNDVRLDAMFAKLEQDYQAQAHEKQVSLTFSLPPKLPVIQGDRERLVVAMQNLLGNAFKYTPAGGKVEVAVEATPTELTIDVRDSGIGIPPKDLPGIFEKFYRAEDRRIRDIQGTGLGLPLAREVARLHGGDITVTSQVDTGSTFTLQLPITAEAL